MGHARDSVQIHAQPDEVFELVIDAARWPEWQTTTTEARAVDGALDSAGKEYGLIANFAGQRVAGAGRVTICKRPEVFEIVGSAPGGGRMVTRTTLEPMEGGTLATIEIDYELPGGFLAQLLGPVIGRQVEIELHQSALNLKSLVEGASLASLRTG